MNTKEGYAKKSLTDIRILLAGGGDTGFISPLSTSYIPETNISIRDATSSDFISYQYNSLDSTTSNDYEIMTLKNSSNVVVTTVPSDNQIVAITTESLVLAQTIKRLVFKFGDTIVSIVNAGHNSGGTSDVYTWMYLTNNPLCAGMRYYFKFKSTSAIKMAYYLGTDIKFISSTASGTGGSSTLAGLTDVTVTSPVSGQVLKYNGTNWVNGTDSTSEGDYLPLSGGILTGALTLPANLYEDNNSSSAALFLSNSNIRGVNSIYFSDLCDDAKEGIQFYRDNTHVDSLYAKNGHLYFTPNRTLGNAGTDVEVITKNNLYLSTTFSILPDNVTYDVASGTFGVTDNNSCMIQSSVNYKECKLVFRMISTSKHCKIGLTNSVPLSSMNDITNGWIFNMPGRPGQCFPAGGASVANWETYSSGDEFIVEYSNGAMRFFRNGVLKGTITLTFGTLWYAAMIINGGSENNCVQQVIFEHVHHYWK